MSGPEKISETITIDSAHPAFAGHFPHRPIVPGVVLLDEAFTAMGKSRAMEFSKGELASAKFHSPMVPGEALCIDHQRATDGSIRFTLRVGLRRVASGVWVPREARPE